MLFRSGPPIGQIRLFDRFIFVDWSARSKPKAGKDSVWIAVGDSASQELANPRTRELAIAHVRELLLGAVRSRQRILVGFDFPYGYPVDFADAVGLRAGEPPWRRTWTELSRLVVDGPNNANNRFDVASGLNHRLGDAPGPFWGCPPSAARPAVAPTKGASHT